jgi:hypothetical protein
MLTGFKTLIFGAAVAVAPSLLTYLGGVDWTTIGISPTAGGVIGAVIIGLRTMTSTPVGKK